MSKFLDQNLVNLQQRVANMAHAVQRLLNLSITALINRDVEQAQRVLREDQAINEERFAVEQDTVAVIATQQPVAHDLRLLVGVLKITMELERMGDYAKDIARNTIDQSADGPHQPPAAFSQMSSQCISMLERAIAAFVEVDAEQAKLIAREDTHIDALCRKIHRGLLGHSYDTEAELEAAVRQLTTAHRLERFADRVTNICERIVYIETGEQVELDN